MAAASKAEEAQAGQDEFDELLDDELDQATPNPNAQKRRRQGPGFQEQAEVVPPAAKKAAAKRKTTAAKHIAPVADGTAGEDKADKSQKHASGRGSAASEKNQNLDNDMKLVARHHYSTEGSSTKALENLTVEHFLVNADESRHTHGAKLRGVTCLIKSNESTVSLYLL